MLCATKVLKPGPARIGSIGGGITLPRTVPVPVLIAGGIGFTLGVAFGLVILGSFFTALTTGALGAAAGWVAVSYSPLRGESLGRWAGLEVTARLRRVKVNGKTARVFIGICPAPDVAAGMVHIIPGAIDVMPGSVDDRGRFVVESDRPLVPIARPPQTPFPSGQPVATQPLVAAPPVPYPAGPAAQSGRVR